MRGLVNSRSFGSVAGVAGGGSGGGMKVTFAAVASPGTRYQPMVDGGFQWRRLLSSSTAVAEEQGKVKLEQGIKDIENQEKKEKETENALVSSYWGIYRPKITREDGSEWPWNCFMVCIWSLLYLPFSMICLIDFKASFEFGCCTLAHQLSVKMLVCFWL